MVVELDELVRSVGHLGHSDWVAVSQEQVDAFADVTGDRQWIHVDPERARTGPFGTTVAHGYLTLSLAPAVLFRLLKVEGASAVINYGLNKVRFPSPVVVGARVRAGVELLAAEEVQDGVQAAFVVTFEIEGQDKPACVAEILFRYYR